MPETTRDHSVYYQNSIEDPEVRVPAVSKIKVRMGDDARTRGAFKLRASTMEFDTFNEDIGIDRPGSLIVVDDNNEIVRMRTDKVNERYYQDRVLQRHVKGLGEWSSVVDKKGSTGLFKDITVAEAIQLTLAAVGCPTGRIDATPSAVLNYWWLSSKENVSDVLTGLAELAGLNARLDDFTGAIEFRIPIAQDRLGIYGGENFIPSGSRPTPHPPDSGPTPDYEGAVYRNSDQTWFINPFTEFEDGGETFTVSRVWISRPDDSTMRLHVRILSAAERSDDDFLGSPGALRFAFATDGMSAKPSFDNALTFEKSVQRDGFWETDYIYDDTTDIQPWYAFETSAVGYAVLSRGATSQDLVNLVPPEDSKEIVFSTYRRDEEGERRFNSIAVDTRTRNLLPEETVWQSPEPVEVREDSTLEIELTSDDDLTPFQDLQAPTYTVAAGSVVSVELSRTSGTEASILITAGPDGVTLNDLSVRGRYLAVATQVATTWQDEESIDRYGRLEWESAGFFPTDPQFEYLDSWAEAALENGTNRQWTATLEIFASLLRNERVWQTMIRLRPGRLVRVLSSRGSWLGVVRELERQSGAAHDLVDRYKVVCELQSLSEANDNVIRLGLDRYGNDKVLG